MLLASAGSAQSSGNPQDQEPAHSSSHSDKGKEKPYALLAGTVWTADGYSLPGVKVFVRRADKKKMEWITVSDDRGEIWQRVPAGKYDYLVWADVKLGKDKEKQRVETTVHVDNDERVDFGLHLKE